MSNPSPDCSRQHFKSVSACKIDTQKLTVKSLPITDGSGAPMPVLSFQIEGQTPVPVPQMNAVKLKSETLDIKISDEPLQICIENKSYEYSPEIKTNNDSVVSKASKAIYTIDGGSSITVSGNFTMRYPLTGANVNSFTLTVPLPSGYSPVAGSSQVGCSIVIGGGGANASPSVIGTSFEAYSIPSNVQSVVRSTDSSTFQTGQDNNFINYKFTVPVVVSL